MGFFDKIFNNNSLKDDDTKDFPWKVLVDVNQLDYLIEASDAKAQVIFKHSTRCGISNMVLRRFETLNTEELNVDFYFLDLIQYRDVSNAVANRFKVQHESPQLIVIKKGEVVKHTSHGQINQVDLAIYQI